MLAIFNRKTKEDCEKELKKVLHTIANNPDKQLKCLKVLDTYKYKMFGENTLHQCATQLRYIIEQHPLKENEVNELVSCLKIKDMKELVDRLDALGSLIYMQRDEVH